MTIETATSPAATIADIAAAAGITMETTFVPFSRSRNAKPRAGEDKPWQSLNWIVRFVRNGRTVLETDYAQGVGYAPAHSAKRFDSPGKLRARAIAIEIESGRVAVATWGNEPRQSPKPIDPPSLVDVLASLALDSSVLDHATFEDWADDYGYSTDSRSAESTYRQCLSNALALRAALGDAQLSELRDAAGEI